MIYEFFEYDSPEGNHIAATTYVSCSRANDLLGPTDLDELAGTTGAFPDPEQQQQQLTNNNDTSDTVMMMMLEPTTSPCPQHWHEHQSRPQPYPRCLTSAQCASGACRLADLGGRWTCCRCRRGGNALRWCAHPMRGVPDTMCYHVVCQGCRADHQHQHHHGGGGGGGASLVVGEDERRGRAWG